MPPKGATRGEIILRVDKEVTGTVFWDAVKLYSLSSPIFSSVVEEDIVSPYYAFISEYPNNPLTFEAYLQRSLAEEDRGNYARAREIYQTIAEADSPFKAWALLRAVECSINMKDYKKGKEIAEEVARAFPSLKAEANYWLSEIYKKTREFKKSLYYAKESIALSKESDWFVSRAKMNEAYALDLLGECEEALQKYKELAEQHMDQRPLALLGVGGRYYDIGEYDLAIQNFHKLLEEYEDKDIDEDIIQEAKWYAGKAYEHKLDYYSAVKEYLNMVESVSPSTKNWCWYRGAKFRIGYCYLQMGDYKKAFDIWREAAAEIPSQDYEHKLFSRILRAYEKIINPLPPPQIVKRDKVVLRMIGPMAGLFYDFKVDHAKSKTIIIKNNTVLALIAEKLPIKIGDDEIKVANRVYRGKDKGAVFSVPNPLNTNKYILVYCSFTPSFLKDIISLHHGLTDYVIFSTKIENYKTSLSEDSFYVEEGYFLKIDDIHWEPFYSINGKFIQGGKSR